MSSSTQDPVPHTHPAPLRVAAISFLNPAPLMWDFDHLPRAAELTHRYAVQSMQPARCAAELLAGHADLGLVPIAALTPALAIVPGCTIAALDRVRSIQLIVKGGRAPADARAQVDAGARKTVPETGRSSLSDRILRAVRTIAADTASRSSVAYAEVLFRRFLGTSPRFLPCPADPVAMLRSADAALLIGDPALLALEAREKIEAQLGPEEGPCHWFDLAHEWRVRTGLPWVAAVWAARPSAVADPARLIADLNTSRSNGLAHIDDLVAEWTPRIALPPATIRAYLTENIHYTLDAECIAALNLFRRYAAEIGALPPLPHPLFL